MSNYKKSFWTYSLRFYNNPKTQSACLNAQFQLNADVNMILYILFKAQSGKRLNLNAIQEAVKDINPWRFNIVVPLRQVRLSLKDYPYGLPDKDRARFRAAVKKIELTSERLQQEYLETLELESDSIAPSQAARDNLATYFHILGADITHPIFNVLLQRFDTLQQENNS